MSKSCFIQRKRLQRVLLAGVLLFAGFGATEPNSAHASQIHASPQRFMEANATAVHDPIYLPLAPSDHATWSGSSAMTQQRANLKPSTPDLIEAALAKREITEQERILYLAYALYEPQSLPIQFQSNVGWLGSQYVQEIQRYQLSIASTTSTSPSAKLNALQQTLSRLAGLAATVCDNADVALSTDSSHFHFNYGPIGGGLAISDYISSIETTYGVEVTSYGWAKPPLCAGGATCSGATNPWNRYPVQVIHLETGLYGYVTTAGSQYTGFVGDNPNTVAPETQAMASCMVLDDDFSQFPEGAQAALDATTGHEFVHAIQNGYGDAGSREDAMWYESSASYMEDEVFDNANSNYFYLWPVVSNALGHWPNNGSPGGISQYSNFLFFRHVAEHTGGSNVAGGGEDVMQRFWENVAAGQAELVAYNNALLTKGTTLADAFHRYAIAARFIKSCGAGYVAPYCFEEGNDYVTATGGLPSIHGSVAANPGSFSGNINNHYAVNWVNLPIGGSPYQVTLSNIASGGQLRGSIVCDTGSALTVTPLATIVGANSVTSVGSFNATGCTSVVLVITNQEQLTGNPSSITSDGYTVAVGAARASTSTPTSTPTSTVPATATSDSTLIPTPTATAASTLTSTLTPTVTQTPNLTGTSTSPSADGNFYLPILVK